MKRAVGIILLLIFLLLAVCVIFIKHFITDKLTTNLFHGVKMRSSWIEPPETKVLDLSDRTYVLINKDYDPETRGLLLFFHGQYGNMSFYEPIIKLSTISGFDIAVVDYPGFGIDGTDPTIRDFSKSVGSVGRWARSCDYKKVVVWGESLGGNAALKYCNTYKFDHVILASTFFSASDMIKPNNETVRKFAQFIFTDPFDNGELIGQLPRNDNITILHSKQDSRIPYLQAIKLANACKSEVVEIGGDHTNPCLNEEALGRISDVLEINNITAAEQIFKDTKDFYHEKCEQVKNT